MDLAPGDPSIFDESIIPCSEFLDMPPEARRSEVDEPAPPPPGLRCFERFDCPTRGRGDCLRAPFTWMRRDPDAGLVIQECAPLDQVRVRMVSVRLSQDLQSVLVRERLEILADRASLTRREREVLKVLIQGLSRTQIAETLGIQPRTVKFHEANLLRKLGVASRGEVLRLVT
ncbi:MAG: LuxR family transcriptional regulator [Myxococcales bacterium]|nr:LuxR family transcriptional regulator [Myxococcales bacterium]